MPSPFRSRNCRSRTRTCYLFFSPTLLVLLALLWTPVQAQTGGMDLSQYGQQIQNAQGGTQGLPGRGMVSGQQPDMSTQTYAAVPRSAPKPPSRLEQILSARAGVKLQQFGYDQLGSGRSVTIAQTGAVPDDYILGPGDQIIVTLRGQENSEFRAAVDRNGQVLLPRLSPIAAIGRSFGSFREDLAGAVHRAYVATDATVSLATVRQISVLVSGEVDNPGQRTLSGLSSVVDALLLSGGVRKTGSLRNIRIQRAGHEYTVDLYSVLTSRGGGTNLRLADGDRILVPTLGRTVAVTGLVRQPGIYELPGRQPSVSVRTLLALAGGQEVRGRYRLSVLRVRADGQTAMEPLTGEGGTVGDSEILFVLLGADQSTSQATLAGGTGLAGQYAIQSGTRLSDVLRAPGALGATPYTPFGIIVRRDPHSYLRAPQAFSPIAVLNGREDQSLQSDDVIRILSVNESRLLAFIVKAYLGKLSSDQLASRNPLTADLDAAKPVIGGTDNPADLSAVAQQFNESQSGMDDVASASPDLQRADITALLDLAEPGTIWARRQNEAYADQVARKSAQALQETPANSQYNGAARQGGGDTQSTPAAPTRPTDLPTPVDSPANYLEQPVATGGFATNREVHTFGELANQLGMDPLVLVNFLIDYRARIDGAVAGPGYYFVGPNVALNELVQAAGGTTNWADQSGVELLTTLVDAQTGRSATQRQTLPLRQGMLASYIVRPHDQLRFNRVFTNAGLGSVTVQGEVHFSGSYPITRGEHLSEVLARAGGLTATAYPTATVYLRKSAAAAERNGYLRAADEIQSQLLVGMTRVGNNKIPAETFAALQSFINRLRTQKAMGRVTFTADPSLLAAHPEQDPLVEAGDTIYIPQRPSTVSVLGEVMQPGTYAYRAGAKLEEYVQRAGGYGRFADENQTFIVLPDGSARKLEKSWLNFDVAALPPGSSIVVPRDMTPFDTRQLLLDVTGILSSLAVSMASLVVITR
jgi:polysaccharide export outer membrane protein